MFMSTADRARSNWLKFQKERCMLASKQNESSIGKHAKVLESLLGEGMEFPLPDSFQNKSYGKNDRYIQVTASR